MADWGTWVPTLVVAVATLIGGAGGYLLSIPRENSHRKEDQRIAALSDQRDAVAEFLQVVRDLAADESRDGTVESVWQTLKDNGIHSGEAQEREYARARRPIDSRWQLFAMSHDVLQFRLSDADVSTAARDYFEKMKATREKHQAADPYMAALYRLSYIFSSEDSPSFTDLVEVASRKLKVDLP